MPSLKRLLIPLAIIGAVSTGAAAQTAAPAAYKVAIHVNENNPATMNLALNNVQNVIAEFKKKGERIDIEVVTYGPGLHMLRDDTSPVKARIATIALEHPGVQFTACGNTQANQSKAENREIKLVGEAKVHASGVVRLIELQRQGYAYVKP